MANPDDARAVKSLNNSEGRKRFVFKTFSQKINDIDINVFRSLDKEKAEPSEGSTFFRDCLVEWRELNTAADFIFFYEEMLPFVQTLPLVILQKELIFSKLVSRLQMKARLSLEPILRLIAALSRDLLEDFLPFLPRVVNSFVTLLKNGADKEPDIIEQMFLTWYDIIKELQNYLICDIKGILRDTLELRYHPKDYISEFMSDSMSHLFRKASDEQFKKGMKIILSEVAHSPQKTGGVSLLYYIMRGSYGSLHSKAEGFLKFLLKDSTLSFCDNFPQGPNIVVEVVSSALQRICEDFEAEKVIVLWKYLYKEIEESVLNKKFVHSSQLLKVLTAVVRVEKGRKVHDYPSLVGLMNLIMSTIVASSETLVEGENLSAVVEEVLQLILCTINKINELETVALQWAPTFSLKISSLLTFLPEFLQKDQSVVKAFTNNILSAINNMIWESSEEVIPLLLTLCERQETSHDMVNTINQTFESKYERIHEFLEENIKKAEQNISNTGLAQIDEAKLAAIWGVVSCYPYFKVNSPLLICFKKTLRQRLALSDDTFSATELMWQSLLGTTLRSCYKLPGRIKHIDLQEALSFAKDYKSCVQVLSPVADFLDFVHRSALAHGDRIKAYPELHAKNAGDTFDIFSENLRHPNKDIRLMTLRILCHFETLSSDPFYEEPPPKKKMNTEELTNFLPKGNVLQLLRSVEETALTVDTGRMLKSLISRIQEDLSAGRIHTAYVKLVLNGMLGLFHNRYSELWGPASDCLAVLVRNHIGVVWTDFVCYVSHCQLKLETLHNHSETANHSISERHTDLIGRFNSYLFPPSDSTPTATVVSQLLLTLQKVSNVAQSRASDILPLLLKFLGYNSENPLSVGSFNGRVCKGEDWKRVLIQWLTLLKLMKNPSSFRYSQFLNYVLLNRFLDDSDAEIQTNALECLLLSNEFLLPHRQHLLNLIKPKELREEITTWDLSKDIGEPHRSHIFSFVVRILMPKVRTLKNSASRKHTSIRHRTAVLCFISQLHLDVNELAVFFALLIKPLNIIPEETMDSFWSSGKSSLDYFQNSNFLKHFTGDSISTLSRNQKSGFLHVIQHILEVFDEVTVRPFLDFLMGCVVRLLVNYAPNFDEEGDVDPLVLRNPTAAPSTSDDQENSLINHDQTGIALKAYKELRSLCLKIIASVLDKYKDCDLGSEFWDLFFLAVSSLIKAFKQEGSSSEKPSSLFSCFLSMSNSRNLVTLLCREESLVPDIFSILTVTTASEAIKSSALKFIENLLCLDNELGEDDNMISGLVDPYMEALINNFHSLFIGDILKRKSVKYHGEREIKILKLLSKRIRDRSHVMKYLDILLTFLDKSVKDADIRHEALLAIQYIVPLVGIESTSKILKMVSPLLVDAELDVRLCICDLLESLAKVDFSLNDVAKRVRDMNAISAMEVDDLDYEKIVDAYVEINTDFFNKSSEQHTMIILSQSMYNLSSESIMLRGSAQKLLSSFIDFSASVLRREDSAHSEFGQEVLADVRWTGDRILSILRNFVLKHIGDAINRGGSIIKEWIFLVREMVTKLPDAGNLSAFRPLCSEDENVDFFKSIVHIQAHRKARAVSRFSYVVKDSNLPEGVVRKLLVSVFFNMLLDGQDGKDNNVRNACTEALASISAHMSWKSYYALLNRCFREMNKPKKGKLMLRLICLILDKFHFAKDGYPQEAEEIRTCLQKVVFPKLQKLINSDPDNVNVNSSVAALKVLKLLPEDVMDSNLSSIVHKVVCFLKHRLESIRDEARLALAACLKELGLEYLKVIVDTLRAILKRGSQVHVLGFTLNFILSKSLTSPMCGKLDHCLVDLLAVVEIDILGEVAEQKEVEKFASKMKETRQRKSLETLKLIAENVTFRSHGLKLLSPVTAQLQRHVTPKIKTNLEKMLKQIAAGIEGNPSVDQGDLFLFIYGCVDDGINNKSGFGDHVSSSPSKQKWKSRDQKGTAELISGRNSCPHLITVFALDLLYNRLQKLKPDDTDEELLSKLDPFVTVLAGCLRSKYEDIVSSSLRCFTSLISFPLPSLIAEEDQVKTVLLTIAQSAVSSSSPLVEACLKLLTKLLRNENITLSSEQLKMLVQFPMFVDLESDPSFNALKLLNAIVKRKLVVPEIYDIAIQVSALMVKSQLESIQQGCKKILLQFMVHYPLSEKRLEQHVNFLLENLRYEHPTGRKAVLGMLKALIKEFSKSNLGKQWVLDQHSKTLFVQLALCLANDIDKDVRSKIGAVIELLIGKMSKDQVDSSLLYCLCWYKQQDLQAAAAQVLGFFIDAMKKTFRKHIYNTVQDAKMILESAVSASSSQLQDTVEEASLPLWKEAYYSLVMIEKMLEQFPDLGFGKDLEDIWKMVFKFLLYPHAWLRSKSCRLLNHYFKALAGRKRAESHTLVVDSLLRKPSSLFMVAVSLCLQLKEQPATGNVDVDLLTENIVFAVSSLHSLIGQSDQATHIAFWSSLGEDEQVVFLEAFELLLTGKGRSTFLALTSGNHTDDSEDVANNVRNALIGNLLKSMGNIALDMECVQMRVVFSVYKAFTSLLNKEECRIYAYKILLPLYKVCEGYTGKIITDELKQLAEEVRDSVRDKTLGNQMFVEVYSEIRKSMRTKRDKRKREEKLMAVVNPERNAKRKLRLASKNKANKKRRITSMKLSRWARS